jgi:LmbE family N-acetylglucosaminyl deacetylase
MSNHWCGIQRQCRQKGPKLRPYSDADFDLLTATVSIWIAEDGDARTTTSARSLIASTRTSAVAVRSASSSRGSPLKAEETARRRAAETVASCEALGAPTPTFLDFADGSLPEHVTELTQAVEQLVEEWQPKRILVLWFLDDHADHRAVSQAVADARVPEPVEVWGFEWWTALVPNRLVDITGVWARKEKAAACHVTAAMAFDVTAWLGMSRWRSLHGLHGAGYGEAFIAMPHAKYRALSASAAAASSPTWS